MSDELTICEDEANQIIDEIKGMIDSTKGKRGKTRMDVKKINFNSILYYTKLTFFSPFPLFHGFF